MNLELRLHTEKVAGEIFSAVEGKNVEKRLSIGIAVKKKELCTKGTKNKIWQARLYHR